MHSTEWVLSDYLEIVSLRCMFVLVAVQVHLVLREGLIMQSAALGERPVRRKRKASVLAASLCCFSGGYVGFP